MNVTVTCTTDQHTHDALAARYALEVDQLPGQTYGPYTFREMREEIYVVTSMQAPEIRGLLLDAWSQGSATATDV